MDASVPESPAPTNMQRVSVPNDINGSTHQRNWWRPRRRAPPNDDALAIRNYFRRWLARFKLGAHLLDLSCLLFELSCENLHLLVLQSDH